MARLRLSFVSSLALAAALFPAAAMAQSILPTTAYNMQGTAQTLASSEEHGITGRLATLREGNRLATRRAPASYAAPFTDMQKSNETLHDLRPTTSSTTTTHKTSTQYKLYNPAVYRDAEPPKPADTWIEREYDELMRKTSIGGGAANATLRDTKYPRQRIIPNMADRVAKDVLEWTAEVGSAGDAYKTATNGMPRHTMLTLRESQRAAIASYRGQPLSNVAKYENAPPPVIYDAQNPPPASYVPPQSSMTIRQAPNYAVALDAINEPAPKKKPKFIPFTKPTDTGSFLWSDEAPTPAAAPVTAVEPKTELPLLAQEPINPKDKPAYGAKAIPLASQPTDSADTRWGAFVSGITGYGFAKHQATGSKAKTVRSGFTAGGDYRLMDKSYIGAALTYIHSTFTTGNSGELKGNSTALSLYGTTDYATHAYVDGYISLGYHALDSERTAIAGGAKAESDPDGFQFTGKAETGYDFKNGDFKYGPYAGLRMSYATFGDYSETGAGANNLNVDGVDDFSTITSLGIGGSMPFAMSNGGTFLPSMRLAYNHEFGDRSADINAVYADGSGTLATPDGAKKSRDWISLAPSLTAALANNWTFQLQYAHDFFRDFSSENVFNLAANYKW